MLLRPERLIGVHHELITVMTVAARYAPFDLLVIEGVRTKERQEKLVARGSSWTMRSRHLVSKKSGFAHAVDIAPHFDTDSDGDMEPSWAWPDYYTLEPIIKQAAADLDIPIEWGGDWTRVPKDGPHWQLPAKLYT